MVDGMFTIRQAALLGAVIGAMLQLPGFDFSGFHTGAMIASAGMGAILAAIAYRLLFGRKPN